jgi:hypothetical protein
MGLLWLERGGDLHHGGDSLPGDEENITKPTGSVVLWRAAIAWARAVL